MNKKNPHTYLLGLCALLLAALCFASVYGPLHFDSVRQSRERVVKERLLLIRQASETYRKAHGTYASTLDLLVAEGLLADTLTYIPFAVGERFAYGVTTLDSKSDRTVPVMECGAEYVQYLVGMDADMVSELAAEAIDAGGYPGLKFGDLTRDSRNAANWE